MVAAVLIVGAAFVLALVALVGQVGMLVLAVVKARVELQAQGSAVQHAVNQHALLLNERLRLVSMAQAEALEKFAESQRTVVITVDGIAVAAVVPAGVATKH